MMRNNNILMLLAAVAIVSCGRNSERQQPAGASRCVEVKAIRVELSDNAAGRNYVGNVKASRSAVISARHSGVLNRLNVAQGSHVAKGAVVAEMTSETLISAREAAEATFRYAQDAVRRVEQVQDAGGVTQQRLVEIRTEYDKARATLQGAENAVEECRLKAPFAGVVGDVHAEPGESISALSPVVTILDISSLEIEISVPEAEMSSVRIGDVMEVRIPALDGQTVSAKVASRGIVASPVSHTYTCTLVPIERAEGMLPGMACSVRASAAEKCIATIPATAVKTDQAGRYVWIAKDGRADKRHISISGYSGNDVVVSDGLDAGDLVIVSGMNRISTGMNVKILGE